MKKAVEIALKYVGQQEEVNNSGFKDENFEARMDAVGWKVGQPWCAYFVELVWKEAFPELKSIKDLFDASAVKTYSNFYKSPCFICDKIPEPGAIVIWQNYLDNKPQWTGHAGIVESAKTDLIYTIEGNTNSQGGREGIEVSRKKRPLAFEPKNKGLILLGFIKQR